MSTRSPDTVALSPSTPEGSSRPFLTSPMMSPSGSESFASTGTETVRPGRITTESFTAYGAWLMFEAGAIPTWTVAVASFPSRSRTL